MVIRNRLPACPSLGVGGLKPGNSEESPPSDAGFSFEVLLPSNGAGHVPGIPQALGDTHPYLWGPHLSTPLLPRPLTSLGCAVGWPESDLSCLSEQHSRGPAQPWRQPTDGCECPLSPLAALLGLVLLKPGGLQTDQRLSPTQAMTQDAARGHNMHRGPHPARPGALLAWAQPQPPLHLLVR